MNLPEYQNFWGHLFKLMSFKYPVFKTEGGGNGPIGWVAKKKKKDAEKMAPRSQDGALHLSSKLGWQCLSRHMTISSATCLSLAYGTVHSLRSTVSGRP